MTLYEDLKWRGLIQDISDPKLIDKLNAGGMTFYIGTDPTADSLHLGHYSSFLITRRLAAAGHTPLLLVGMATGLIGDPRGTVERKLSDRDEVMHNYECLKRQLQTIFPYELVLFLSSQTALPSLLPNLLPWESVTSGMVKA